MTFSLLTLNIWNTNEPLQPRYLALAAGLKTLRADIICLQEVDRDPKSSRSQSELFAEMSGLAHVIEENGLATLCRFPISRWNGVALPEFQGDAPRMILLAECLVDGRSLLIANTHLAYPPAMTGERKEQVQAALTAIRRHRSGHDGIAKVLCGDFNDVSASPAVRAILEDDEKFRDAFYECNPTDSGITYSWKKNRYVDPRWTEEQRIDYIFSGHGVAARKCCVVFDGSKCDLASDHFGVFARLEILPPVPAA